MSKKHGIKKCFLVLLCLLLVFSSLPLMVAADSSDSTVVWSLDASKLGVPGTVDEGAFLGNGAYQPGIQIADKGSSSMQMYEDGALGINPSGGTYKAINIQTGTAVGGTNYYATDGFIAEADKAYTVTFSVYAESGIGQVRVRGNNTGEWQTTNLSSATPIPVSYTWTQSATGGNLQIDTGSTAQGTIVYITDLKISTSGSSTPDPEIPEIPVILYHRIVANPTNEWTDTSISDFKKHMKYLEEHGYTTLSSDEYVNILKGSQAAPPKPILLTFDDATPDFITEVIPVLDEHHMKAVLFVISDWIGAGYSMTLAQLENIADNHTNISIENHSKTHSDEIWTNAITKGQAADEITAASAFIEGITNRAPVLLAYPYGNHNSEAQAAAQEAGIAYAFKVGYPNTGDYAMGRHYLTNTSLSQFAAMIGGPTPPPEIPSGSIVLAQSFEDDQLGGWMDLTWNGTGTVSISDEQASDGSKSLKYSNRSNRASSPSINLTSVLASGRTYDISFKLKLSEGTDSYHLASKVDSPNLDNIYPWLINDQDVNATDWTLFELKGYQVPADTSEFIIWVEASDKDNADLPKADFYIDEFLIKDVSSGSGQPEEPPKPEGYHESFEDGVGVAKQSGGASLTQVTGKIFDGNADGAALYISNRNNDYDAADFFYTDTNLENGKTYTITVKGYVDEGVEIPSGAKAYLQTVDDYALLSDADFVAGEAFTLTKQFTVDTEAADRIRIQSNDAGKTVPFYVGDISIVPSRLPALDFATITFEDQTTGGFEGRAGTETLTVTNEDNHTEGGSYALKVEGRSDTWHGPSLRVEKYVDLGHEYKVSAWVKLISPASSQVQLSTQVGSGGSASYNILQGKTISKEDGWVKFEGIYRYDSVGDEYLTIYVESANNATASFYIDDISFEPTGSGPVDIQRDLKPMKEEYQDYFLIGNAISAKDLEGIRLELLQMHHNVVTAENAMKPGEAYSNEPGKQREFDFTDEIALVDNARAKGLQVVGHVLVWHQQSPEWLYQNEDGSPLSREEALTNMRNHIKAAMESVGDKVISWDVVNEAIDDTLPTPSDWRASLRKSGWYHAIGPDFVEQAFLAAQEVIDAHPEWEDIKLYYNDYNDDNQNKAEAIYQMVKEINERYAEEHPGKLLIDGIGMQGHYNINTNPTNVERSIVKFSSLGVEISITELDITDNRDGTLTDKEAAAQGYLYAQLFKIFKEHKDKIARVTFWGLDDATSWRSEGYPLLFDRNLQAKNTYYAVIDPDKYLEENALEPVEANHSFANYGTPVIDGVDDEEVWATTPILPINQYQMAWQGASGNARVLWDEENLYVLIHVNDDQLDKDSANAYEQDSIEVFVDENNGKTSFYQDDDGQYRVNFDNETSFNPTSASAGFESMTKVDGTNYTVELKIPFKKVTPEKGMSIGFDAQINDAKGTTRESIATWNDLSGVGYQDTSVFGVLTLIDGLVPPTDLTATSLSASSIKLDWDYTSEQTVTFNVYRSTSAEGTFELVADDLLVTAYTDSGLSASTTYYYQVIAKDGDKVSDAATASAKTLAASTQPTPTPEPTPQPEPEPITGDDGTVTVKPEVIAENGRAKATVSNDNLQKALEQATTTPSGKKQVIIEIEAQEGADASDIELPKASLASDDAFVLTLKTPQGMIDVPSNMLSNLEGVEAERVTISIAKANTAELEDSVREQIGNRPVINLNVLADGHVVSWSNPNAAVTVSIPYTPSDEELAHPDHILIWYIDGEGNATAVLNARYDAESGVVRFQTTHFSTYAVTYVMKSFQDIANIVWAKPAIEAMASRDIIKGVSEASYDPGASIKRADVIALLVRALELQGTDDNLTMFSDVKESDYFYNEVRIAKSLGIAAGTGNNEFKPHASISRQDMMVLAARAMAAAGMQLTEGTLDAFSDADQVSEYAKDSVSALIQAGIVNGMGGKIAPNEPLTRAQAAVILYNIWKN